MNKKMSWIIFISIILLLAGIIAPVSAQEGVTVTDDDVNDVARDLYCPVCENISLDVCPTQACEQWRSLIREKLEAGWTKEQIQDYFATQYGDRVLPEPPKEGINWLVYILPPAMIGAGALILARVLKGMRKPVHAGAATPAQPVAKGDEYLARIEKELQDRKG